MSAMRGHEQRPILDMRALLFWHSLISYSEGSIPAFIDRKDPKDGGLGKTAYTETDMDFPPSIYGTIVYTPSIVLNMI